MAQLRRSGPFIGLMIGLLALVTSLAFAQAAGFQVTSVTPGTIDPAKGQYARIAYTVPTKANFRVYVENSAGSLVCSIGSYANVPAGARTTNWNGRDRYNRVATNGTYRVVIEGKASDGTPLATGRGTVIVGTGTSTTPPPTAQTITVTSVANGTFDPSAGQTATVNYTVPVTLATLTNTVVNSAGATVRTLGTYSNVQARAYIAPWNGKDGSGKIVADGAYTVKLTGKDRNGATVAGTATVTVKTAAVTPPPPTAQTITVTGITNSTFDPSAGQTTTVNYTVPVALSTLTNTVVNSGGTTVRTLGTYPNTAARNYIAPWNGKDGSGKIVADGAYTIRFAGKDTAGAAVTGSATVTVKTAAVTPPPTTGAFAITNVSPATIDASKGETTTITYTVPTAADLRVAVRNSGGGEVRVIGTYTNVASGTRTAAWDGKDGSGKVVADGAYTVVVDGTVAGTATAITAAAAAVTVSTGTVAPPPPPPTGVMQEFGYPIESKTAFNWEGWRYGDMKNKFAAAFTAQKTGTVTRLACEWKTQGAYGAGNYGYYDLQVVPADARGWPDTTKVLASELNFHPLNGGQPRDGWQLFNNLDRSFQVTQGQRYWMVISPRSVSASNYSCPNTGSGRAIKFVDTQLLGMDGYVVASYNYHGANAWRGWISGDGGFPASWKSGASNTTHATQRGAIGIFYSDGSAQGQAGYWGSGGSGNGYDRIYNGMSIGEQIYWNRPNVTITRVGFFVGKVGSPSASLNWAIKNVTTGATLASGSIAAGSVLSEANQININLSPTIALVRGQTYRISLSSSTSSSAAYRFWGACYDQGTATTDAIRYAAFTGASNSQTTLQYSTDGTNWNYGGNGRSSYAFDMPFSLWGSYQ